MEMVSNSSRSTPKHGAGKRWASHWAPSHFSSKMRMFSSNVLVELVFEAAQKASQVPQDNLEVCSKRPSPATVLCYLIGTGESEGTPPGGLNPCRAEQEAETVKGSKGWFDLDLGTTLCTNKDNSAFLQMAAEREDPIQVLRISVKIVQLLHPGVEWPSVVLSRFFSIFFFYRSHNIY